MKKIVLAAVLATAALAANAQVTISGKVSQWIDRTEVGTARDNSMITEPTSNFAVSAKESLGRGMTARTVVETSLSGNTIDGNGTKLGDRQMTVGLANRTGSIDLGRNVHSQFLAVTTNDAFGTLYGSVAGDVHNLRGLRMSNGVFLTANPVKGATLSYDRADGGAEAFGIRTTLVGVNVTVARYQNENETSNVVGLNKKFGNTTAFFSHSDDSGLVKSKGSLVGVKHQMGNVSVKASYGKTNRDIEAYALGADYHLSKRTEVGVAFKNVDRLGANLDVQQVGVGITHRF